MKSQVRFCLRSAPQIDVHFQPSALYSFATKAVNVVLCFHSQEEDDNRLLRIEMTPDEARQLALALSRSADDSIQMQEGFNKPL